MKKHIVCLGDSNTHGSCPDPNDSAEGTLGRFNEEERWTCLLQKALGEDYLVLEEGLSGRTTVFDDPLTEGLAAIHYVTPCLMTHEPVSLLIIMLGTNDTKERFGVKASMIGEGMKRLIRKAQATDCWGPGGKPNILVICPPPIGPQVNQSPAAAFMGDGVAEKAAQLPPFLRQAAEETGCHFLDAGELGCEFNHVDFMHLSRKGHATLAETLAQRVPGLVP